MGEVAAPPLPAVRWQGTQQRWLPAARAWTILLILGAILDKGGGMSLDLDKDLLAILCCPETKQPVCLADGTLIKTLNDAVSRGTLHNKGKKPVTEPLDGGLVRADQRVLYPIRQNIPIMLIEEGIPLAEAS